MVLFINLKLEGPLASKYFISKIVNGNNLCTFLVILVLIIFIRIGADITVGSYRFRRMGVKLAPGGGQFMLSIGRHEAGARTSTTVSLIGPPMGVVRLPRCPSLHYAYMQVHVTRTQLTM